MPKATQLSGTYPFINPLLADTVLAKYGNNARNRLRPFPPDALPLFAIALHLDIEDLDGFATDCLTDHPSDKKADIIYISEADGVACVAQGYTGTNWGKQGAPANKASDLNTAVAWLLRTPIDKVPKVIKAQAKLLRDGLTKKSITKLIFAYQRYRRKEPWEILCSQQRHNACHQAGRP